MDRIVKPEKLDSLPPFDPEAVSSRKDLRIFNAYLGTRGWFAGKLLGDIGEEDHVLEIGAGEGTLIHSLHDRARGNGSTPVAWTALDLMPVFREKQPGVSYVVEDLLRFPGYGEATVVIGNMILHQFEPDALEHLGRQISARARLIVFQEPARSRFFHTLCRCCAFAMSPATRHDAPVSIEAGFRGNEIPLALGLSPLEWDWRTATTLRGAHRLVARRRQ